MKFSGTSKQRNFLPTNTGQMGVLTNHALLLLLDIGVMSIRTNKDWTSVALGCFAL
jgi:F0F1-type ATP synthase epsilon subunit